MQNDLIFVVPEEGFKILHPDTFKPIPEEGLKVRDSLYWKRMKAQGAIQSEKVGE